jgi:hypothetical protein
MAFTEGARKRNWTDIKDGRKASLAQLDSGYKGALDTNKRELALYQPYADTGLAAFNSYADASGVNGQAGYDRAEGNFRASPGYQWQVDQATDAVARKASSLGALGSGNTQAAITDRASHLADLEYDDYLGRLDNIGKTGFAATSAKGDVLSDRAGLFVGRGRDKANVYQHATDMKINSAGMLDQMTANAIQGGMMASQNAAANRWNFGMQGVKLLADFAGSASGSKLLGL